MNQTPLTVAIPQTRRSVLHRMDADWAAFPFWRIVKVVSGAGVYEWPGGRAAVAAGVFLLLRPGQRRIRVSKPLRINYLPFDIDPASDPAPALASVTMLDPLEHDREVMEMAFQDACRHAVRDGNRSRCVAQIQVMLTLFRHRQCAGDDQPSLPERLREVAARLATHPEERLSVPAMARRAGFSIPHFSREFRRHFGLAPAAYAIRARMDAARELLTTEGLSVKETAYSLNYPSPFAFSRQFRRHQGCAPIACRRLAVQCSRN